MAKLSAAQKADLKKLFDKYDVDKNGEITAAELKSAFAQMGFPMSDVQIANIIGKADTDGSGTIDFDEFCASNETKLAEDMFKKYDKNGDGFLGADEVVLLAKDLGCGNITIPQAKRLIATVDKNGDGKISFEEFKALNAK